jgi:hypothetical protein
MSITQKVLIDSPARNKAEARYRRKAAAARRAADRSQSDAQYNAAIARLHAANEELQAAYEAHPKQYIQIGVAA